MIVLCAGLIKSGSGFLFNVTNDLVVAAGGRDIRALREARGWHGILKYANCLLEDLGEEAIAPLLAEHRQGSTFAVKTHAAPIPLLVELLDAGVLRVVCSVRDPRDAAVSAFRHGQRIRAQGEKHSFAICTSLEVAIRMIDGCVAEFARWLEIAHPAVLRVNYEDLLADSEGTAAGVARFLGASLSPETVKAILRPYRPEAMDHDTRDRLHFDRAGRAYYQDLPPAEADRLHQGLATAVRRLGYRPTMSGFSS